MSVFITALLPDVIRYKQLEVTNYIRMYRHIRCYALMMKRGKEGTKIISAYHVRVHRKTFLSEKERGKIETIFEANEKT